MLADPWTIAAVLDSRDAAHIRQLFYIMNHLLFPGFFESIASRRHKKDNFQAFATGEKTKNLNPEIRIAPDRALLDVRGRLGKKRREDFSYYTTPLLRKRWWSEEAGDSTVSGEDAPRSASEVGAEVIPDAYRNTRFWLIGDSMQGHHWADFHDRQTIAVGWEDFGLELAIMDVMVILERIIALREGGSKPTNDAKALIDFSQAKKSGNYVFVKQGYLKGPQTVSRHGMGFDGSSLSCP